MVIRNAQCVGRILEKFPEEIEKKIKLFQDKWNISRHSAIVALIAMAKVTEEYF
jgi:hypothetical protein